MNPTMPPSQSPSQTPSASATPSSPAENGRDPVKKRQDALRTTIAEMESQLAELEAEHAAIKAKLQNDPATTVQRHIKLLHEYNEIKDIGQGLMGLIADARGVRQIDVQREFGVGDKD